MIVLAPFLQPHIRQGLFRWERAEAIVESFDDCLEAVVGPHHTPHGDCKGDSERRDRKCNNIHMKGDIACGHKEKREVIKAMQEYRREQNLQSSS